MLSQFLAALLVLASSSVAVAGETKRVLVVYPTSDGQPGILRFQESLRIGLMDGTSSRIEIYNEYLDSARFPDERYQSHLADFLRTKYLGREPDVIIPALAPSLDFVLKYRDKLFPGVPVVFGAIDKHEAEARTLGTGVLGVPMTVDLEPTLDLALRLHPETRRVVVVSGKSRTDAYWAEEARRAFRRYESKLDFVYLTGLPLNDLLREVANLPDRSVVYYLHVFEDGLGTRLHSGGRGPSNLGRGERTGLRPLQHVRRRRDRRRLYGPLRDRGRERGGRSVARLGRPKTREHRAIRSDQEPDRGRLVSD